jgi:hypothetical protein
MKSVPQLVPQWSIFLGGTRSKYMEDWVCASAAQSFFLDHAYHFLHLQRNVRCALDRVIIITRASIGLLAAAAAVLDHHYDSILGETRSYDIARIFHPAAFYSAQG